MKLMKKYPLRFSHAREFNYAYFDKANVLLIQISLFVYLGNVFFFEIFILIFLSDQKLRILLVLVCCYFAVCFLFYSLCTVIFITSLPNLLSLKKIWWFCCGIRLNMGIWENFSLGKKLFIRGNYSLWKTFCHQAKIWSPPSPDKFFPQIIELYKIFSSIFLSKYFVVKVLSFHPFESFKSKFMFFIWRKRWIVKVSFLFFLNRTFKSEQPKQLLGWDNRTTHKHSAYNRYQNH